jgi:predicted nucleotidyltransferase
MVTRKNIINKTFKLLEDLRQLGVEPVRVFLFGSYAKGNCTDSSDIDVAVWGRGFSGIRAIDIELVAPLLKFYKPIELHTFPELTDIEDPYQKEILETGIDLSPYLQLISESGKTVIEFS